MNLDKKLRVPILLIIQKVIINVLIYIYIAQSSP